MKNKWTRFAAVLLIACFSFGGSFSCKGSDGDDNIVVRQNG